MECTEEQGYHQAASEAFTPNLLGTSINKSLEHKLLQTAPRNAPERQPDDVEARAQHVRSQCAGRPADNYEYQPPDCRPPRERRNPDVLNGSRKRRIAAGAGTTVYEVNQLVRQFKEMQKLMKQMQNKKGFMGLPRFK